MESYFPLTQSNGSYPNNRWPADPPTWSNPISFGSQTASGRAADRIVKSMQTGISDLQRKTVKTRVLGALKRKGKTLLAQKRQLKGRQINLAGGESKSMFTLVKFTKPVSTYKKLGFTPNCVVRNFAARLGSTIGVQNAQLIGTYFDATDVQNAFTAQGLNAAAQSAAKIMFQSIHSRAMLNNCHNANCHITIYDVLSRRDGGALNVDPVTTFKAGLVDAQGGAAANYATPGTSPFANPRFTECYKVLKVTDVVLSPGATHTHHVHYAPNRLISEERLVTNGSVGPLGGVTVYSFIVFHGTPENDVTTKTQVSLGQSDLDLVLVEELKYLYNSHTYANNSIVNSLPLTFTVGGNTMNDEGVVQTDATA